VETDIAPENVHGFLFSKAPHEKKIVERAVVRRAACVKLRQFIFFVDRDLLLDKAGMVVLSNQFRHSLRLEEGQYIGELVVDRARGELLRITKERNKAQQISSLDLLKKALIAEFLEVA
jgi:hypothetical protein